MQNIQGNITGNDREWPVVRLASGGLSAEILPAQGLSIISFKYKGRELLDQWNIEEFVGAEKDIEAVSRETTAIFRKGFGPSIGPWFGAKVEGAKGWQHGVCRFADWRESLEVAPDSVTGRLNGSRVKLLGKTLDEICGFHLDVAIIYTLKDGMLVYRVKNRSEDGKGTYGIHWYFRNPKDTKVILKPDMENLPALDPAKAQHEADTVVLDMNQPHNGPLCGRKGGLSLCKARIVYADGFSVNFTYDDIFQNIVVFNTKEALCVEPVSDRASTIGEFSEGEIHLTPVPPLLKERGTK